MNDLDRAAREAAISHSTTRSEALDAANAQAEDWTGRCQYCNAVLHGTMATLAAHTCKEYEATL